MDEDEQTEFERLIAHDAKLVERVRKTRAAAGTADQPTVPRLGEWAVLLPNRSGAGPAPAARPRTASNLGAQRPVRLFAAGRDEPVRAFPTAARVDGSMAARPSRVAKSLQTSKSCGSCGTASAAAAELPAALAPAAAKPLSSSQSLASLRFAAADVSAFTSTGSIFIRLMSFDLVAPGCTWITVRRRVTREVVDALMSGVTNGGAV